MKYSMGKQNSILMDYLTHIVYRVHYPMFSSESLNGVKILSIPENQPGLQLRLEVTTIALFGTCLMIEAVTDRAREAEILIRKSLNSTSLYMYPVPEVRGLLRLTDTDSRRDRL